MRQKGGPTRGRGSADRSVDRRVSNLVRVTALPTGRQPLGGRWRSLDERRNEKQGDTIGPPLWYIRGDLGRDDLRLIPETVSKRMHEWYPKGIESLCGDCGDHGGGETR